MEFAKHSDKWVIFPKFILNQIKKVNIKKQLPHERAHK